MYKERHPPTEPPCETCRVELMEDNREAAQLYMLCKRQVITAGETNEIIDLNYITVKTMMDLYGVTNQKRVFESVLKVFYHFLSKEREARQ